MEYLAQYVKGELGIPGTARLQLMTVNVLPDTGLGVISISEGLPLKMPRASPARQLTVPFRVCSNAGEIWRGAAPLLLTLLTPWGSVRCVVYSVILPRLGELIILGPMTLREVLSVDVMQDLKRIFTRNHSGRDDDMYKTRGDAKELIGMRETPGTDDDAWEDEKHGPVLCEQGPVWVAVEAFGV